MTSLVLSAIAAVLFAVWVALTLWDRRTQRRLYAAQRESERRWPMLALKNFTEEDELAPAEGFCGARHWEGVSSAGVTWPVEPISTEEGELAPAVRPGDLVYGDPCPACGHDGWPAGSAGNARRCHELDKHEGDSRIEPRWRSAAAVRVKAHVPCHHCYVARRDGYPEAIHNECRPYLVGARWR